MARNKYCRRTIGPELGPEVEIYEKSPLYLSLY